MAGSDDNNYHQHHQNQPILHFSLWKKHSIIFFCLNKGEIFSLQVAIAIYSLLPATLTVRSQRKVWKNPTYPPSVGQRSRRPRGGASPLLSVIQPSFKWMTSGLRQSVNAQSCARGVIICYALKTNVVRVTIKNRSHPSNHSQFTMFWQCWLIG